MNLLEKLLELLPVLASMNLNSDVELVIKLIAIAEQEVGRRIVQGNKTRTEVLENARQAFTDAIQGADDLLNLGHE